MGIRGWAVKRSEEKRAGRGQGVAREQRRWPAIIAVDAAGLGLLTGQGAVVCAVGGRQVDAA
jgi:hypothetical protein